MGFKGVSGGFFFEKFFPEFPGKFKYTDFFHKRGSGGLLSIKSSFEKISHNFWCLQWDRGHKKIAVFRERGRGAIRPPLVWRYGNGAK